MGKALGFIENSSMQWYNHFNKSEEIREADENDLQHKRMEVI